ncbi:coiled-coil domain-containing protein 17 isoform X2 [Manacus candei]|uniref:coiled-coil domain-containing protein 17 isoform X2 n=1 Tax=Manacus candei TaxID=415023 RepID=UPI0022260007|nr:coiled-coil domain-containing protein 17 isoform X2 [Manacus candei]
MGSFPCPRCRMAFSSRQLLRAHREKLCLGIPEPTSSCLHGGNPLPEEGAPGTAGRPRDTSVVRSWVCHRTGRGRRDGDRDRDRRWAGKQHLCQHCWIQLGLSWGKPSPTPAPRRQPLVIILPKAEKYISKWGGIFFTLSFLFVSARSGCPCMGTALSHTIALSSPGSQRLCGDSGDRGGRGGLPWGPCSPLRSGPCSARPTPLPGRPQCSRESPPSSRSCPRGSSSRHRSCWRPTNAKWQRSRPGPSSWSSRGKGCAGSWQHWGLEGLGGLSPSRGSWGWARSCRPQRSSSDRCKRHSTGPPSTSTPSCHPRGRSLPRPGHCDCPTCAPGDTTRPSWTSCSTSSWRPRCWRKEPQGCAGAGGWGLDAALLAVELENWRLEDEVLALKVRRERRADAGSRAAQRHSEELAQLQAEVGMLRCHAEQAGPRLPPPILPPAVAPSLPPALAVPELFMEPPGPALGPGSPTGHVPHSLPLSPFVALEDPPPAQEPQEQHRPPRRLLEAEGGTPRTHSRLS